MCVCVCNVLRAFRMRYSHRGSPTIYDELQQTLFLSLVPKRHTDPHTHTHTHAHTHTHTRLKHLHDYTILYTLLYGVQSILYATTRSYPFK